MLKFFNKKGTKVMEMTDNGDVNILSETLKESFSAQPPVEKTEEKENENDN